MRRLSRREALAALAAGAAGVLWWQSGESDRIRLERHTLRLPRWRADGFRVALLGDTHVNAPADVARAIEAAELAVAAKPDAIVLAGDYVNYEHPRYIENLARSLEPFRSARCPVVAVLGNHDYWVPRPDEVIGAVGSAVRLLRNEAFRVGDVAISGFDDMINGQARFDWFSRRDDTGSVLAVLHEPDFVGLMPKEVGLMLAGHSHGGQVCLPFGVPLRLPYGGRKYRRGFYADAPRPLFVTRGVGVSGPPFRSFCPPDVSLLTLRSA